VLAQNKNTDLMSEIKVTFAYTQLHLKIKVMISILPRQKGIHFLFKMTFLHKLIYGRFFEQF